VTVSGTAIGAGCGAGSGADAGRIDSGDGRGAAGLTGIGVTLTGLLRVGFGLRCICINEFRITATIPAKQSSSTEINRPGTLNCPLPRDSGDRASVPMILAREARIKLLVTETMSPQIPSPRITAIRRRTIHLTASAGGSGDGLAMSSIRLCDANCATAA
jgi:hypothetical protein